MVARSNSVVFCQADQFFRPGVARHGSMPSTTSNVFQSASQSKSFSACLASAARTCKSFTAAAVETCSLPADLTKSQLGKKFERHRGMLPIWALFVFGLVFVWYSVSDGDFSFSLTMSSVVSTFSFFFLLVKVFTRGAEGISFKMLHLYMLVTAARLSSILFFNGYLPYDSTGTVVYRVSEVLGFVLCSLICLIARSENVEEKKREVSQTRLMTVGAFLMALCFHLSLNKFVFTDVAWAFGLYLESMAVLPQLICFYKEKKIDASITHFIFAQSVSKVLAFFFWFSVYLALNRFGFSFIPGLGQYVGYFVIFMQAAQLIVLADFVFIYVRAFVKGVPMEDLMCLEV